MYVVLCSKLKAIQNPAVQAQEQAGANAPASMSITTGCSGPILDSLSCANAQSSSEDLCSKLSSKSKSEMGPEDWCNWWKKDMAVVPEAKVHI